MNALNHVDSLFLVVKKLKYLIFDSARSGVGGLSAGRGVDTLEQEERRKQDPRERI
jgi:hypothetical protein